MPFAPTAWRSFTAGPSPARGEEMTRFDTKPFEGIGLKNFQSRCRFRGSPNDY
jgi:hypothetical protein